MAFVQWHDGLSVEVVEIDRQHQKIVGMINDLHDAMIQRKGADLIGTIIESLAGYSETHFRTEEKYFDQFGYPDANSHKQEHAEFSRKMVEFKDEYRAGTLGLSVDVMALLSSWLQNHIKVVDKRYVPFFKKHGL